MGLYEKYAPLWLKEAITQVSTFIQNLWSTWILQPINQVFTFFDNIRILWETKRIWIFGILVAIASVDTVYDAATTRIYKNVRIHDVQNNTANRIIKVDIPQNPDDPPEQRRYITMTLTNLDRWSDLCFDATVVEGIANTMLKNQMEASIQVSWRPFTGNKHWNLNNIFVNEDPHGLLDTFMKDTYPGTRFFKPDNYLRSGGHSDYPWLIVFGTMGVGFMLMVLLSWLIVYRSFATIKWMLGKLWYVLSHVSLRGWERLTRRFNRT